MVGRTPSPPRAVPRPVPRSPGGHRTWAVRGPGCATRHGGVTPYPPPPPPRAVASAMRWVWLCTEHIAAPDRCSGSTAPAPSRPAARGPAGPGRAGLPRSVPRWSHRASLPLVLGSPAWTLEPLSLPHPSSWPRGARRGSVGARPGVWGKGNREAAGATSVGAERVRRCSRILGAALRPWAAREGPGRVGAKGFCLFSVVPFFVQRRNFITYSEKLKNFALLWKSQEQIIPVWPCALLI